MRAISSLCTAAFLLGQAPRSARAEPPVVPPTAPATAAAPPAARPVPDVVILKSGGIVRGAISELNPGLGVTIVTATGETQRIPIADVAYAGPADRAPPSPARPEPASGWRPYGVSPGLAAPGQPTPFKFVSYEPLTLQLKRPDGFTPICTAPCETTLPAGTYQLGLSQGGEKPLVAKDPIYLWGPSTIEGSVVSHKGQRIAGWTVFGTGLGIGGFMLIYGMTQSSSSCTVRPGSTPGSTSSTCDDGSGGDFQIVGGLLALVGVAVGVALALRSDEAAFNVVPAAPPPPAPPPPPPPGPPPK
jgi:hypothetical protein